MMEFSVPQQTVYFFASIALGAALAAVYDLIRAVRMLIRCSRGHILVSDILFFFVCGVITSLFALPFNKGDVRGFTVFGEAIGFLTYRLTLGSIFGKFYAVIARLLRHIIRKNCEKLKKIYDSLLKAGAFLLYNIVESIDGFRRTAISGVKVLVSEASDKRRLRREKRARRSPRGNEKAQRSNNDSIHAIPHRRGRFGIIRKKYEKKRPEKRKKRKKTSVRKYG